MKDQSFHTRELHDLLDRGRAGDNEAYNKLIWMVMKRLERLARAGLSRFPLVRGRAQTDDVLQNSLLRLLKSLQSLRPGSTREFFGLAATQIRRELLDLANHFRKKPLVCETDLGPATTDDNLAPLDPSDSNPGTKELDHWTAFHKAVEELPVAEREVIGLTFYHGWTQVQIAELLQVSDRHVRNLWRSACERLRTRLGEDRPLFPPES